jgi:hypothetical protein
VGLAEGLDGLFVVDDSEGASPVGTPQAAFEAPGVEHAGEGVPDVRERIGLAGQRAGTADLDHRVPALREIQHLRQIRPWLRRGGRRTGLHDGQVVDKVAGDRYGAAWVREAFKRHGIHYVDAQIVKDNAPIYLDRSSAYLECEPLFASGLMALLDHPVMARELTILERRPSPTGKDRVDHPKGMMTTPTVSPWPLPLLPAGQSDDHRSERSWR